MAKEDDQDELAALDALEKEASEFNKVGKPYPLKPTRGPLLTLIILGY